MRRNSTEIFIIVGVIILILVGVILKSRKAAAPMVVQSPAIATPGSLPSATVPVGVTAPTVDIEKPAGTVRVTNKTQVDILCLRAARQVFYLPRILAVRLTRNLQQNSFFIPASHGACLKKGPWKFWISDFDPVSHLPYRYYFEMSAVVTEVAPIDLKKYPAYLPEAGVFAGLFGNYFTGSSLLRITLTNKKFQNFKFGPSDRPPFLLADGVSGGSSADKKYLEGLLYGSMRAQYLAPSDPQFFKPYAFITEDFDFRSRSSLDLTAENLSGIYFRKFGKLPEIKLTDWKEEATSRKDLQNLVSFQTYSSAPQTYYLVDTRHKKISGSLHLPDSHLLNVGWYEDAFSLNLAFNEELPSGKIRKFLTGSIPDLIAKARGKKIVLVGNSENDPVPVFLAKQAYATSKAHFLIMKEGFNEIFLSSYFFRPLSFASDLKPNVDIQKEKKFENYLFLRPTYHTRRTVQPKAPNQIRR